MRFAHRGAPAGAEGRIRYGALRRGLSAFLEKGLAKNFRLRCGGVAGWQGSRRTGAASGAGTGGATDAAGG